MLFRVTLTVVLVGLGVLLLIAYTERQSPAESVPISQLVSQVQQGQIRTITLRAESALAETTDGKKQQTTLGPSQAGAELLYKTVDEYNQANPSRAVILQAEEESQILQGLGSLLLALLPILLLVGILIYTFRQSARLSPWGRIAPKARTEPIVSAEAPKAIGPYAQALARGELIFCSGQVALDPKTGELAGASTAEQTRQVLDNLAAVLRAGGSDLRHVLKTTVYLTDLNDFAEMNAAYAQAFDGHTPARATVQVAALPRGAKVEIECIATRTI